MYDWKAKARVKFAHAYVDLNLCILCMFEGTVLLDEAHR